MMMLALAIMLSPILGVLGLAKILGRAGMPERAAHVGFSTAAYRRIGVLEILGAVGLVVGLAVAPVGLAAAIGLVLLLLGAIGAHLRNGDHARQVAPAAVLALFASAYLAAAVVAVR